MFYIVDGNNLMGRKRSRQELLNLLAEFVELKKARLQVVFDGAPDKHYPENSYYQGVKISYSARGKDADTKIRKILETSANPKNLVIVTSDNDLASYARTCQAQHLKAAEFLTLLSEAKEKQISEQQNTKPLVKGELNEWLRYFGFEPHEANKK